MLRIAIALPPAEILAQVHPTEPRSRKRPGLNSPSHSLRVGKGTRPDGQRLTGTAQTAQEVALVAPRLQSAALVAVHELDLNLDNVRCAVEERVKNLGVKVLTTPFFKNLEALLSRQRLFVGTF